MRIQNERSQALCRQLNLTVIAEQYSLQAQIAAENKTSYTDFLESLLKLEISEKQQQSRSMLTRMPGFSMIKRFMALILNLQQGSQEQKSMNLLHLHLLNVPRTLSFSDHPV